MKDLTAEERLLVERYREQKRPSYSVLYAFWAVSDAMLEDLGVDRARLRDAFVRGAQDAVLAELARQEPKP